MAELGRWFATDFDHAAPSVALPLSISSGADPALRLVDGIERSRSTIGRLTSTEAVVGLKFRSGDVPASLDIWFKAPTTDRPGAAVASFVAAGATRVCLMPTGPGLAGGERQHHVRLPLPPDAIPVEGLLLVEISSAMADLPSWARDRVPEGDIVGLRLLRIVVSDRVGAVTTGPTLDAQSVPVVRGVLVVNPLASGAHAGSLPEHLILDASARRRAGGRTGSRNPAPSPDADATSTAPASTAGSSLAQSRSGASRALTRARFGVMWIAAGSINRLMPIRRLRATGALLRTGDLIPVTVGRSDRRFEIGLPGGIRETVVVALVGDRSAKRPARFSMRGIRWSASAGSVGTTGDASTVGSNGHGGAADGGR